MSNTVKVDLAVSDNGTTAKVTSEAKKLNKELDQAKKTAASIRSASQTSALSSSNDLTDVGANRLAKGISGASGAASRDFAKQAQGLGGLVHVYATFAANLFAVTAGFQALSKAADYTNMIKGLDQLGAASGKNLGTMAKNVADLTDGAVSLKEAMAAVAQASSAGMSGTQIERMAAAAKKASQALGRDMGDSLNRLSRGITKMEPELLDEIGIFVRVDKAAQDYALSVGKTANSLTDFEKRQAFANAALKQAEDKFGKINLDANPFSKLQASFIDLLYMGGEVLNKVLGPIASVLASSPVALGAAMAGIVGLLLKQAIPAMTNFKDQIAESAKLTAETATRRVELAKQSKIKVLEQYKQEFEAEADLQQKSLEKIQTLQATAKKARVAAFAQDIIKRSEQPLTITDAELARLDKHAAGNKKVSSTYKELAQSIREAQVAERNFATVSQAIADEKMRKASIFSTEGMNQRIAEKAQTKAAKMDVLSKFMENVQTTGMLGALSKIDQDILDKAKDGVVIGKYEKGFLKLQAGILGTINTATKFLTVIGSFAGYLGIAAMALQFLDSMFSKNAKQIEEFNKSLESSKEAAEGFARTTEYLRSNNISSVFSTEGINAFANALEEVSSKLLKVEATFREVKTSANTWDRVRNDIADIFNMDAERAAAETYAKNIRQVLQDTTDPAEYQALVGAIEKATGSSDTSQKGLVKNLDTLFNEGKLSKVGIITDKIKAQGDAAKKAGQGLSSYKNSVDAASKSMQALATSFIPSDAMSKFGIDQMNAAKALAAAFEDPRDAIVALADTVNNFDAMKIMPKELQDSLIASTSNINSLKEQLVGSDIALSNLQKRRAEMEAAGSVLEYSAMNPEATSISAKDSQEYKDILKLEEAVRSNRSAALKEAGDVTTKFAGIAVGLFEDGSNKIAQSLKLELEKSAIGYAKTIASQFKGPEATKVQTDLQVQELAIQQKIIDSQMAVILSQEALKLAMEANTIQQGIANAKGLADSPEKSKLLERLGESEKRNRKQSEFLEGKNVSQVRAGLKGNTEMKMGFSGLSASIEGAANQKASLGIQMQGIKLSGEIKTKYDKLEDDKRRIANEQKAADTKIAEVDRKLAYGYDQELEAQKEVLQKEKERLAVEESTLALDTLKLGHTIALNAEKARGGKNYAALAAAGAREEQDAEKALGNLKEANAVAQRDRDDKNFIKAQTAARTLLDIELRKQEAVKTTSDLMSSMYKSSIDKQVSAGTMKKSTGIAGQALLDIQAQQAEYSIASKRKNQELKEAQDLVDRQGSSASTESLNKLNALKVESAELAKQNTIKVESIKIEAEYQKALISTEETLKNAEKTSGNFSEYMGATYQDFSNKISDLVKNTKSAASAFNEGFINAVDSSIDKYFEMLQTSTFKMKDLVNFTRTALSDVFRDTASNIIKGAWKNAIKDFLPKSDEEKASDRLTKSLDALNATIQGKTLGASGVGLSGGTLGPSIGKSAYDSQDAVAAELNAKEGFETSADTNKEASSGFLDSAVALGSGVKNFLLGSETNTGIFQKAIEGFANLMPSWLTSTYRVIASAISGMAMSGGSSGGSAMSGILGIVLKAGMGYLTGGWGGAAVGGTSALMSMDAGPMTSDAGIAANAADVNSAGMGGFAKGGVFDGSSSLSAYSNSVVSSPTMFAFAKGAGLMGEAGPEAIIPLKRDDQGNLGIRGGGAMENNFSIYITVDGSGTKEDESKGGTNPGMANELGKSIKSAILQELINQKRPGGLLAK